MHRSTMQKMNIRLVFKYCNCDVDIDDVISLQLLMKAIDRAAQHLYQDTIISRLAAVHVVFHSVRKEVLWFGQLVEVNPQILKPLVSASASNGTRDMVIY